MNKKHLIGWVLVFAGSALWLYGYLWPGAKSFVNWNALTPWWIADYLPSREAEIGLVIMCIGMLPLYWPERAKNRSDP